MERAVALLPLDLLNDIKAIAEQHHRPLSGEIRHALALYVRQYKEAVGRVKPT